jgi:hypothetical protein
LRQRGFDFIAQINVNAGGGVSFLFHAAEIKPANGARGEKISQAGGRKRLSPGLDAQLDNIVIQPFKGVW